MGKSKGNFVVRQKAALQRLEVAYEKFKAAGEDKPSRTNASGKFHKGRTFKEECERFKKEIEILKDKISRNNK